MTKIIKEMLPPDVRVARDAQDLLIECCVGEYFFATFGAFFPTILCLKHIVFYHPMAYIFSPFFFLAYDGYSPCLFSMYKIIFCTKCCLFL